MNYNNRCFTATLFFSFIILFQHAVAQSSLDDAPSKPMLPLMVNSNEATDKQLAYARAEGDSTDKCVDWILSQAGSMGGQTRAGEYKITYAFTAPEGWYELSSNNTKWQNPATTDNAHLWLFIQDGSDGRVVPPLDVHVTLVDNKNAVAVNKNFPFVWTPLLNGYGDNISLPKNGNYVLNIEIMPPHYRRHDPYNGDRFMHETKARVSIHINTDEFSKRPLSEEMEAQQSLAKGVGNAYKNTLKEMYQTANDGSDTTIGDYMIAYAVEYAEGYWKYHDGRFRYAIENEESAETNAHVEVGVCDAKTGRFLHNLYVTASLFDKGKDIGLKTEPFMWHPWLYHYGENWRIPSSDKNYKIHVHFDPPAYRRYGKTLGKQFTQPIDIDFTNANLKTGEK